MLNFDQQTQLVFVHQCWHSKHDCLRIGKCKTRNEGELSLKEELKTRLSLNSLDHFFNKNLLAYYKTRPGLKLTILTEKMRSDLLVGSTAPRWNLTKRITCLDFKAFVDISAERLQKLKPETSLKSVE